MGDFLEELGQQAGRFQPFMILIHHCRAGNDWSVG
jgi:hypothetical protein